LGSVQQRSDLTQEALSSYKRAIEADAEYVKAAEKMADFAKEKGMIESYMEAARLLIGMDGSHAIRSDFTDMLLQLAQGESDVLDQVAGLPPTLPAGPEMAKEALDLMDPEASPERARALSLSLQHSDAVLMWKELIKLEQDSSDHWTGLARSLEQAGDLETAQKCHAKAASLANAEPEVLSTAATPPSESVEVNPTPLAAATPEATVVGSLDAEVQSPQPSTSSPLLVESPAEPSVQASLLLTPIEPQQTSVESAPQPEVDLAKAALDAAQTVATNVPQSITSNAISNQDVTWFNQGVQLIDDKKYKEALSCFDRALPAFAGDDAMIIRILNNRGNAYYFLEEYPKCVESYHQAMLIRPTEVRGETLYNMGTAYAEMERYKDAIKCFEQAIPRGLADEAKRRAKDQIRRCNILQKALDKKRKKR
jgi:tetratricopeptide (TPR) repeat protein